MGNLNLSEKEIVDAIIKAPLDLLISKGSSVEEVYVHATESDKLGLFTKDQWKGYFKEWYGYVPVDESMVDLIGIVDWCRKELSSSDFYNTTSEDLVNRYLSK